MDICLYIIEADAAVEKSMINDTVMFDTIIAVISSKKSIMYLCKIEYGANL